MISSYHYLHSINLWVTFINLLTSFGRENNGPLNIFIYLVNIVCYIARVMKVVMELKLLTSWYEIEISPGEPNVFISILENGGEKRKSRPEPYQYKEDFTHHCWLWRKYFGGSGAQAKEFGWPLEDKQTKRRQVNRLSPRSSGKKWSPASTMILVEWDCLTFVLQNYNKMLLSHILYTAYGLFEIICYSNYKTTMI